VGGGKVAVGGTFVAVAGIKVAVGGARVATFVPVAVAFGLPVVADAPGPPGTAVVSAARVNCTATVCAAAV
jgi:hypothetical protein